MPFVSFFFRCTLVHLNLCLHTLADMTVTLQGEGGTGLLKKFIATEKCIVVSEKFMKRFEKKY